MKKSEILSKALAEALAEEERTQLKFGEDQEDGAVIAFKVRFVKGGVNYDYAALRSGGLWYTTGPKAPKAFTWQSLTAWLDGAHRVSKITVLREGKAKKEAKIRVAQAQHPAYLEAAKKPTPFEQYIGFMPNPFLADPGLSPDDEF